MVTVCSRARGPGLFVGLPHAHLQVGAALLQEAMLCRHLVCGPGPLGVWLALVCLTWFRSVFPSQLDGSSCHLEILRCLQLVHCSSLCVNFHLDRSACCDALWDPFVNGIACILWERNLFGVPFGVLR